MEEENFFGKTTPQEPSPERVTATFMSNPKTGVKIMDWEVGASGYDVAWGGDRKPGKDGKLPSVGSTVDVANATWTNTIGAPELITFWQDPAFNAAERAFYYARVLEIPTPRWTAYDAKRFGTKPLPGTRMTVVERAYTAPIWYTSGG